MSGANTKTTILSTKIASDGNKTGPVRSGIATYAIIILLGIGTGLVSMMLGASYFGMPMFFSYFNSPLLVLLNILPPVLLLLLAYYLTGRAWVSFLISSLIVLLLSVISFFKIQVRNEPFIFSDIKLISEASKVAANYPLDFNWKVFLAGAYILGGTVFSGCVVRRRPRIRFRLLGCAAVLLASSILYFTLFANPEINTTVKSSYAVNVWSNTEVSISKGSVYPFIYSIYDTGSSLPSGYKADEAAMALKAYGNDAIPADKRVNIVSMMLESYADLSTFSEIDFSKDVYGPLHEIESESVHGYLVDNIFAGGTIDTERSFLTGFSKLGDFVKPTNSYVRYLNNQGYVTEGFHAGNNWYYNRTVVNSNLGFDRYYFLEDFPDLTRWDSNFFPKVEQLFDTRDKNVPYFSYNLSYQNHGPYSTETTGEVSYIEKGELSDESYNILNNYLTGVEETTRYLADFIDHFRELDEPVIVVFFGDHKPWLGNDNSVYKELGINIDVSTEDGFYNFYTTPYSIWANDAAKKTLGNDFKGDGGNFSPCFLMNKVFELCSWYGNAYMKAADEMRDYTSIIHSATGCFSENGALVKHLSPNADTVYNNFEKFQYNWQNETPENG